MQAHLTLGSRLLMSTRLAMLPNWEPCWPTTLSIWDATWLATPPKWEPSWPVMLPNWEPSCREICSNALIVVSHTSFGKHVDVAWHWLKKLDGCTSGGLTNLISCLTTMLISCLFVSLEQVLYVGLIQFAVLLEITFVLRCIDGPSVQKRQADYAYSYRICNSLSIGVILVCAVFPSDCWR